MSSPERSRPRPRKRPQTPPKRDSSTPEPEQQQTPPSSAKGTVAPPALTEARAGVDISRAGTPPKRAATQKAEGSTNRDPSAKPHAETTTSKGSHDHHDSAPKPAEDRDVQLVINWDKTPEEKLALEHQQLTHPLYKSVSEVISCGDEGEKLIATRIPLDPADAVLDEDGFRHVPTQMVHHGLKVEVGRYPLWGTTLVDMGRIGGAGLRLYFSILKLLACLCFAFGVVTLPTVIINIGGIHGGGMYAQKSAAGFSKAYFVTTTLGNIRAPLEDIDAGNVTELWFISLVDVLICAVILAAVIVSNREKEALVEETDFSMVTMGDYTIWVRPHDKEEAWPKYGKAQEDIFIARLKRYLEETIRHKDRKGEEGKGVTVADIVDDGEKKPAIWVTWDEDENICLWNDKLSALYALESALAVISKDPKKGNSANGYKALQGPLKKLEAINAKLLDANSTHFKPIGAFVTFEDDDDYELALEWADYRERKRRNEAGKSRLSLEDYNELVEKFDHFEYPEFEGQRLDVEQAPEPEVVMWSHLEYFGWAMRWRRWLVNAVSLAVLIGGALLILGANYKKGGLEFLTSCESIAQFPFPGDANGTVYCDGLPLDTGTLTNTSVTAAQHYREMWLTVERDLLPNNPVKFPTIKAEGSDSCRIARDGACCDRRNLTWAQSRDLGCLRADTLDSITSKGGSREAICYACVCQQSAQYSKLIAATGGKDSYCAAFQESWIVSMAWTLVAVCIVATVNQLAKLVMESIVDFEQNDTTGGEQGSLAIKIFIAQFMFTGVAVVFVRLKFSLTDDIPVERFDHASARFYAKVLAPLILTMGTVFMAPPSSQFGEHIAFKVLKKVLAKITHTQNGLNLVQEDSQMKIASNFGEVLMGLCVTLLYSTPMPILYWLAGLGFSYKYWMDKWAVLRAYRKPPLYGHDLFDSLEEVIFTALTVHAGSSWYFLSMVGGMDPNKPIPVNMWRPHCIPMFITFIIMFSVLCTRILYVIVIKHTEWGKHHMRDVKKLMKALKIKNMTAFAADAIEASVEATASILHMGQSEEQRAKREEVEEAHRQGDKGETLRPFSQALATGMIVNEDDDYHMDEHENSRELEVAFMDRVHEKWESVNNTFAAERRESNPNLKGERPDISETDKNMEKIHEQKLFPFHDEAIARRMYDAVKNPVEDGDVVLHTHNLARTSGRWQKVRRRLKTRMLARSILKTHRQLSQPAQYTVMGNVFVYSGMLDSTDLLGQVKTGTLIVVLERQLMSNNHERARFKGGWLNMQAANGTVLLKEGKWLDGVEVTTGDSEWQIDVVHPVAFTGPDSPRANARP